MANIFNTGIMRNCNNDNRYRNTTFNLNVAGPAPDFLRPHVVDEAMHDSGEVDAQGYCHPGTRYMIQEMIKDWADNPSPDFFITWLFGAAGAGKSAIMRTMAKTLEQEGKYLGGFFCFRSSTGRNDASLVIPTLVDQIIRRIPSLRPLVDQAFVNDPGLLKKTMEVQATLLIVEPFNSMESEDRTNFPNVVLIDGLDEINGLSAQQAILKTIAFINERLHTPLHFLIASRPEPPIRDGFNRFTCSRLYSLPIDAYSNVDADTHIFYIDHFREIRDRYLYLNLPRDWPGLHVRRMLVEKGSGQFIFASVVVAVVGDPSSTLSPQERLSHILEVTEREDLEPFEQLDLLYVTVLNQIPKASRSEVLRILGLILVGGSLSPNLDNFKATPKLLDALFCPSAPGTIRHRLCHLHSVLHISDDNSAIRPLHATLGDFVFSKARSARYGFHVDKEQLQQDLVVQITKSLLVDSRMPELYWYWGGFFREKLHSLSYGILMERLAAELQAYDKPLSSLPPFAVVTCAAPISCKLSTSSWSSLSQRILDEVHRRAQRYLSDFGRPGTTLLSYFLLHTNSRAAALFASYRDQLRNAMTKQWREDERSALLSMDRTSGLGLAAFATYRADPRVWYGIFHPYRNFIGDEGLVRAVAELQAARKDGSGFEWATVAWYTSIPFNERTISSLFALVRSANQSLSREGEDSPFANFVLAGVRLYLNKFRAHKDKQNGRHLSKLGWEHSRLRKRIEAYKLKLILDPFVAQEFY